MTTRSRPHGTLVVGVTPHLAQHCLLPALPAFRARYPDISIDLRSANRVEDIESGVVDVYVLLGWPQRQDLVQRRVALTRQLTCAAPAYWARHGVPAHPGELERHVCLLYRNPEGTVLDLWEYERNGKVQAVTVGGWLASDHRDNVLDAAIAGEGVVRLTDLTCRAAVQSSRLVPVLLDWNLLGAPPIHLLYGANQRRTPRVRVFIDFVTALFRDIAAARDNTTAAGISDRPSWHQRRYRRASTALRGR